VNEYHPTLTTKEAQAGSPPRDYEYGMRDFCVHDHGGNQVGFGAEITQA
jgi:hypothetical protein